MGTWVWHPVGGAGLVLVPTRLCMLLLVSMLSQRSRLPYASVILPCIGGVFEVEATRQ